MTVFRNYFGSKVAKAIAKPFVCPKCDEGSWSEITVKELTINSKVHYALLQGLNDDDFSKIIIAHVHMIFGKF